ncbi:MAG: DUF4919 domain-containing protein [Pyrinomonadaceae bacterium]|nr:DUF4919 domain-containing protein [Phycisphaerales bacterium]
MKFTTLYEAAKQDPTSADFGELRQAWIESQELERAPQANDQADGQADDQADDQVDDRADALQTAMDASDHAKVAALATEMIEAEPISIRLHLLAATAFELSGNAPSSEMHKEIARGLIRSILESGDGQSFETAFHVVSVEEEYAIISLFGGEPKEQTLQEHEGHAYDVITIESEDGAETGEIFFNVDLLVEEDGDCCGNEGCCGGH